MDDKSEALCKIAVTALTALVASTEHQRHREMWKQAVARVQQTRRDIESDEEIAALRQQPRTTSMELKGFERDSPVRARRGQPNV